MDPVYAGTIAGMVLLFGGFVCGLSIYVYKECQMRNALREHNDYTEV
jgi:hypothetical protein